MLGVKNQEKAFTLLEVLITLAILVSMVYAIAQMVRFGFDVKESISQKSKVTHRFNVVLEALSRDLAGAFIVSSKDLTRDNSKKRTLFRITRSDSDSLAFTFVGHRAIRKNAKESDLSYTVYQVKDSKAEPGRKHLYRSEAPRIPNDFKEELPSFVLAEDIASIKIEAWNGDSFSKEGWDSTNGETRDLLPRMVRVSILAWEQSPEQRLGQDIKPSVQYSTILYLPFAMDYKEPRTSPASYALFK